MDASRDRITLTSEELRILADLERRAIHVDPKLHSSLTAGSRMDWLHSRRFRDIASVLLFPVGIAIMLATFTRWPVVAAIGIMLQAIALRNVLVRWAPRVGPTITRLNHKSGRPGGQQS